MDVSKNRGTPKWVVYNGKPSSKFGSTIIFGNTQIAITLPKTNSKWVWPWK